MKPKFKIIASFIGVIILFIIIKISFPQPKRNKLHQDSFWIEKTHGYTKFNIIVCGDSRIYRGFSITDLENRIEENLSGINIGYSSAGFSDEYLEFAISKLDKNTKNQILVLGITPHSLTHEAFKNTALKSIQSLSKVDIYKGLYLSPFFKHFLPYEPSEFLRENELNYIQKFKTGGWVASSYLVPDSSQALASYKNTFSKYQVSNNEVNSFLKKVEEITRNGINIIAFRPPSTYKMRILEDSISGFDEKFIKEELIKRNVIWLDIMDSDFESYDGSHLHYNSAKKLSGIVGDRINKLCLTKI